jgi:hypothetical protein
MKGTEYRVRPCGRVFNSGLQDFDNILYWRGATMRMLLRILSWIHISPNLRYIQIKFRHVISTKRFIVDSDT